MMDTCRIPVDSLTEDYINAHYYAPRFLENEKRLASCGVPRRPIGEIASKCNCGATPVNVIYDGEGQGLIRTSDVRPNKFEATKVLRTKALNVPRDGATAAISGDLVFTMSGTIGYAAVIRETDDVFSFSNTIARVRFAQDGDHDPYFMAAFFNSAHGYTQSLRLTSGGIQGHVMPNPFKRLLVLTPSRSVQRYIGDKVRQAERLRARASYLLTSAIRLVELLIDREITEDDIKAGGIAVGQGISAQRRNDSGRARHTRTRCVDLTNRIDAWYYQPHLVAACEKINKSGSCQSLGDVIDAERDVKGGATPLGAEYLTQGSVRFYRTSDVSGLAVHAAGAVFLTAEQDCEMARSRLAEGDVLLTITGADFGHAGAITKHHLPGNISQHSVRFRPTIDESYLVAYMESNYGQQVIWRQAYGATRPAIDYPGVKSLLIRVPDPSAQKVIGDAVRCGVMVRHCAMSLATAATLLIEALIEGRVSEADLQVAHRDCEADQAILRRLTVRGLDVAGELPLFADFDALRKAMEESECIEPSNGGAT